MAITKIILDGKELIVPTLEDVLANSDNGVKNKVINTYLKNNPLLITTSKDIVNAINELKTNSIARFTAMPTPSALYANGEIYQYIGNTTSTEPIYKHGSFYECKEDSTTPGTYVWTLVGASEGNFVTVDTDQTITGTKVFSESTVFKKNPDIFTTIYSDGSIQLTNNDNEPKRSLTIWPDKISVKKDSSVYNIVLPTADGTFALQSDIAAQIKSGVGAPTQTTYGKLGQLYIDSDSGKVYHLDSKVGTAYNWSEYTGPLFKDVTDFPDVGEENYIYRAKQSIIPGEDPQLVCKFYSENAWHPLAAAKIAGDEDVTNIYTKEINLNKSSKILNKDPDTTDCATTLLSRTDDDGRYVFYGGSDWDKGAFMEFYGQDVDPTLYSGEDRAGSLILGTGVGSDEYHWELTGTREGDLTWKDKKGTSKNKYHFAFTIRELVSDTTRSNLFNKVPKDGDTMLFNMVKFREAEAPAGNPDTPWQCEVHRNSTDLYGYIIAKHRSGFYMSNNNGGTWTEWYRIIDGRGGTMKATGATPWLKSAYSDKNNCVACGGTSYNDGASIWLSGKSFSGKGSFGIDAYDGTTRKSLIGNTDGYLAWGGYQIGFNDNDNDWVTVATSVGNIKVIKRNGFVCIQVNNYVNDTVGATVATLAQKYRPKTGMHFAIQTTVNGTANMCSTVSVQTGGEVALWGQSNSWGGGTYWVG